MTPLPTTRPVAPTDDLARTCDLDGCGADAREWRVPPGSARCPMHAGTVPMAAPDPADAIAGALVAMWSAERRLAMACEGRSTADYDEGHRRALAQWGAGS